jgi:Domain of unknown function (DUF4279)
VVGGETKARRWELGLYLRGERLDPVALTALLGVTPTSTRTRGQTRALRSGHSVETKVSVWHVKVTAGSPTECVSALVTRFGDRLPDLSRLPGVEDAFLDMFVTFEPGKDEGTEMRVEWDSTALRQLAECGLPLEVTFAVVGL